MSPTLFSVYLNDLATEIKKLQAGIDINGKNVGILLYADDIVLLASTEQKLQEMIDVLYKWSTEWNINVNKTKSKIVQFRKSNVVQSSIKFKCGETPLHYVSSYKYLGEQCLNS